MSRPGPSSVRVVVVFPDLLGTYGDAGNASVIHKRLAWRDIHTEIVEVLAGHVVPRAGDLYLLGGGEDANQLIACDLLRGSGLVRGLSDGATCLAVCAGLQMLGHSFERSDGQCVAGLGVLDLTTEKGTARLVGDVIAHPAPELGISQVTGFENHSGRTTLGPTCLPFAEVQQGHGNGVPVAGAKIDGARTGSVIGTYLHGPVLARNPELADWLLWRVCGRQLPPIDLPAVTALRHERFTETSRSWRARRSRRAR